MKDYIVYRCVACGCTFILPLEDVQANENKENYISCPFKGHKNIVVAGAFDDLKQCMEEQHIYKRDRGCIKQIK